MSDSQSLNSGFNVYIGVSSGLITLDNIDIKELYFIEDIFSFCMSGKMVYDDRYGLFEFGPLTGNEKIGIVYGEEKDRRIVFNIIKVEKVVPLSVSTSSKVQRFEVHFVDTSYKQLTKKIISKSWKETNAKTILENILSLCESDDEYQEKIILKRFDSTDDKYSFIMPYWTAIEGIKWLNCRTKPSGSIVGGYLYYSNTYWSGSEGKNIDNNFTVAWKSINSLFSCSETEWLDEKPYVFSSVSSDNEGSGKSNFDTLLYVNKIIDWNYDGVDTINTRRLGGGAYGGYNFDCKNLISLSYRYSDSNGDITMLDNITGLGKKSLFPKIDGDYNYELVNASTEDEIKSMIFNDWLRSYSRQQSLSIIVRGSENRFAGKMIKDIKWDTFDRSLSVSNKNLIGPYLIKSITHSFSVREGYMQRLILLKNAYYDSKSESLMSIKNNNPLNSDTEILKYD